MAGVQVSPFPDPGHFGWGQEATEFALRQLDYTLQTLTAPDDTAAFFVEPVLGEAVTCPRARSSSPGSASAPTGTGSCSWWTRSRPVGSDRQVLGRRALRRAGRHPRHAGGSSER